MQLDGSTVSWAIPKGLLGISKKGESSRLAVETTLHPISYTVFEGPYLMSPSRGRTDIQAATVAVRSFSNSEQPLLIIQY